MVKIAVLKETAAGETRVSASPETVKKFIALGASVYVEKDAGVSASIGNSDYESAGATVESRSFFQRRASPRINSNVDGWSLEWIASICRSATKRRTLI